jgi:FkbM family methyltransferase
MGEFYEVKHFVDKYKINGVLHIGAHLGEEAEEYNSLDLPVIWFEPDPVIFEQLDKNISFFNNQKAYDCALGSKYLDAELQINFARPASSLLNPTGILSHHPHAVTKSKVPVKVFPLTHFSDVIDFESYNFWVIDTQGYELEVLQGAESVLGACKVLQTEYSHGKPYYEGGALYSDIEAFLGKDWIRVKPTSLVHHGDAVFVRKNLI